MCSDLKLFMYVLVAAVVGVNAEGRGRAEVGVRLTGCNITPRLGARWLQAADTWPAPRRPTQELWMERSPRVGGGRGRLATSDKRQRRERKMKQHTVSAQESDEEESFEFIKVIKCDCSF